MAPLKPLLSESEIRCRVLELAGEISAKYADRNPILLGVLKGSLHFLSDLSRALSIAHEIDFVRLVSYPIGREAAPTHRVEHFESLSLASREVLVVDDILDRGHTARALRAFLLHQQPASLKWAFLLVKTGARERSDLDPEYVGFEIGEEWVVGYGMDLDERLRHLPGVYTLREG